MTRMQELQLQKTDLERIIAQTQQRINSFESRLQEYNRLSNQPLFTPNPHIPISSSSSGGVTAAANRAANAIFEQGRERQNTEQRAFYNQERQKILNDPAYKNARASLQNYTKQLDELQRKIAAEEDWQSNCRVVDAFSSKIGRIEYRAASGSEISISIDESPIIKIPLSIGKALPISKPAKDNPALECRLLCKRLNTNELQFSLTQCTPTSAESNEPISRPRP